MAASLTHGEKAALWALAVVVAVVLLLMGPYGASVHGFIARLILRWLVTGYPGSLSGFLGL